MSTLALKRYLQRHSEPDLPPCPAPARAWRNVLVVPAYREPPSVLENLRALPVGEEQTVVILVLNHPDSDPDKRANSALRNAVAHLPVAGAGHLRILNTKTDLYLHDLDRIAGSIPARQGVGLARKIGCDIAFRWICDGAIDTRWIGCTDADARLPKDYFSRLAGIRHAAAAVFPFRHRPGPDAACNLATGLYELRLHHYVLGLEHAKSPYAWHTLGSCMAVTADAYAQVRGFPRRAGAEDFYLLNKLSKIAPVARLKGRCIELESRVSRRVPFGTGPAVAEIMSAPRPRELPLLYHPACFEALRCLLAAAPQLRAQPSHGQGERLYSQLEAGGLTLPLARACVTVLDAMGLTTALDHCRRQGTSSGQFLSQFKQWFDGFRTLKFIHGIRAAGWPDQPLSALQRLSPGLLPSIGTDDIDTLRSEVAASWGWISESSSD